MQQTTRKLAAMALAGIGALVMSAPATAQVFGSNLVVNGDAETGQTGPFAVTGGTQVISYAQGGGFPVMGDPGVSQGGSFFFAGGDFALSTAGQIFDISAAAGAIDLGTAGYDLSALLGGYDGQDDNAILSIDFRDAMDASLGFASIGPVLSADRNGQTGFLASETTGLVPIGARSIDLLLTLTRTAGSYNDAYADNLSLVLTPGAGVAAVPEPMSWAMMIFGMGAIGAGLRRRRVTTRVRFA